MCLKSASKLKCLESNIISSPTMMTGLDFKFAQCRSLIQSEAQPSPVLIGGFGMTCVVDIPNHRIGTITEVSFLHCACCSTHPIYLLGRWRRRLSFVCNNQNHVTSLNMLDGYGTSELLQLFYGWKLLSRFRFTF